jgi:unsaturated rhamnogalacturonyl hydrolase
VTQDEKYKKAIDLLYSQIQAQPRIEAGNFWHKLIYPHQVWLDGVYMVQPFYMDYEVVFNDSLNFRDTFSQFKNLYKLMRNEKTGLYYHCYDEKKEMFWANKKTGLSPNYWTRAIGWLSMALVDTLERLDERFFYEYGFLKLMTKSLMDSLLNFADPETKLFYQVTDQGNREGNYLETSGSCAIAYSMMKGARLRHLPPEYYDHGKEIFNSILEHKFIPNEDGFTLTDTCLVAGLGGSQGAGEYKLRDGTFEYYISEPKVNNEAKGVAPFLFAFSEILRHKEG